MILYRKYDTGGVISEEDPLTSNTMMEMIQEEYGGTDEQYNKLIGAIAFHESKTKRKKTDGRVYYEYMNTKARQEGGGPGRGLFQFEEGVDRGGITAVNRTVNYLNEKGKTVPAWLKKAYAKRSIDASTFTDDQQKVLFWGYHRMGPSKLSNYLDGKMTIPKFWSAHHQTNDDPKKEAEFTIDFEGYLISEWIPSKVATRTLRKK